MKATKAFWLLLPLICVTAAGAAPPHKSSHTTHHALPASSAGQRALDRAEAARKALIAKQVQQAATIRARQAAALQAQQRAKLQTAQTATFSHQTQHAQTALNDTQKRILDLTAAIDALQLGRIEASREIAQQNAALQPLLPIAERLSVAPNAALFASPGTASESVEALSIIGGFSRLTQQRAQQLQARQEELRTISASLASHEKELTTLRQSQLNVRDAAAARTHQSARQEAVADQAALNARHAVAQAMQDAADLSEEITRLEKQEAQARAALEAEARALIRAHRLQDAQRASSKAKALSSNGTGVSGSNGHAPVSGRVAVRWSQDTEAGPATGITYATVSGATVNAPCKGRIEFAGPFRSFGQMLILDCGRNYRFVLSGLQTLGVTTGQNIGHSAALGSMPTSNGMLFVQLRHGAQTVNPAPFL